MKECKKCGLLKAAEEYFKAGPTATYSWCKSCDNARMKKWAKGNPEAAKAIAARKRKKNPAKVKARCAANRAIKAGKLTRPSMCSSCMQTQPKIYAHHEDYDQPLEVTWLCSRCHSAKHLADHPRRRKSE